MEQVVGLLHDLDLNLQVVPTMTTPYFSAAISSGSAVNGTVSFASFASSTGFSFTSSSEFVAPFTDALLPVTNFAASASSAAIRLSLLGIATTGLTASSTSNTSTGSPSLCFAAVTF